MGEKIKDWKKVFKMRKKYSKNHPFCFYDLSAKYLPEDKKATVIDIGCGECRFEDYLKLWSKYINLKCLDGNINRVIELRKKHEEFKILKHTAPDRLPFKNRSIDYIFCSHLIEHLYPKELYKLFKEFDRVLKPNGILIVSTPLLWINFYNNLDHVKPYYPSVFKAYFCNLESSDIYYDIISKDYKIEELVYRYHTFVDIHNTTGSTVKGIDFLIQMSKYILRGLGIKKYTQSGYTIILRKGK